MNWSRQERKQAAALSGGKILLEGTLVLLLLRRGLESTVSELGRGVDPLEADLLEGFSGSLGEHGLSKSHDSLLGTRDRALDHDEVVVDLTIADEATETIKVLAIVCQPIPGKIGSTYGVMVFLVTSISVAALSSASPLPMR